MVRSIESAGFESRRSIRSSWQATPCLPSKADHFVFTLSLPNGTGKRLEIQYAAKRAEFYMVWLCLAQGFQFQKEKLERKPVTETGDVRREE